jgi:hypothetical protein
LPLFPLFTWCFTCPSNCFTALLVFVRCRRVEVAAFPSLFMYCFTCFTYCFTYPYVLLYLPLLVRAAASHAGTRVALLYFLALLTCFACNARAGVGMPRGKRMLVPRQHARCCTYLLYLLYLRYSLPLLAPSSREPHHRPAPQCRDLRGPK